MGDSGRTLAGTLALLGVVFAALVAAAAMDDGAPAASTVPGARTNPATDVPLDPDELLELSLDLTPTVARRVAKLRDLRFGRPPTPDVTGTDDLRRIARRGLRRPRVRAQIRAGDAELKLLGLLEANESLGDVATETTALAAAFYDPRRDRLSVVGDAVPAGPAVAEFVLAHELNHALEDERFGLPAGGGVSDDRALAGTALVEGSATALMRDYAVVHLDPLELATDAAGIDGGTGGLPRFALEEVDFAYFGGLEFVDALRRATGDWRLVDYAYRTRPPQTTEQILHPEKYLDGEEALAVLPPTPGDSGWRELDTGTIGEFATVQILKEGLDEATADEAAAGWGGDSYRLWRVPVRGATADAGAGGPCCDGYALGLRWRWDTARDAREFERALERYVVNGLDGDDRGAAVWATASGHAAVEADGDQVALGLASSGDAAARIADLGS